LTVKQTLSGKYTDSEAFPAAGVLRNDDGSPWIFLGADEDLSVPGKPTRLSTRLKPKDAIALLFTDF
jgi:hypothetical protein